MKIKVNVVFRDGMPYIASAYQNREIGTMWDSGVQEFEFIRTSELADYEMLLLFKPGSGDFYEQNIGTGNNYTLNNALTQKPELTLQIAFLKDDVVRFGSNRISFRLRRAERSGAVPDLIPSKYTELLSKAFVLGEVTDSAYIFYNLDGEKVFEIPATSGGTGGLSLGQVVTETLSPVEEARVLINNVKGALNFEFGIPKGLRGDTLFSMGVDDAGNLYADYVDELPATFELDDGGNLYITLEG